MPSGRLERLDRLDGALPEHESASEGLGTVVGREGEGTVWRGYRRWATASTEGSEEEREGGARDLHVDICGAIRSASSCQPLSTSELASRLEVIIGEQALGSRLGESIAGEDVEGFYNAIIRESSSHLGHE